MDYSISLDGDSVNFPAPETLPQPGEVFVATTTMAAMSGSVYYSGDKFELIERTSEAPHRLTSSLGNWRVRCKDRVSIWTNIEFLIAKGFLKKELS